MEKFSVAVVDDNRDWCKILVSELQQYPMFNVAPALHDGKDTIEYLESHRPDVIVLDMILPTYDGLYIINYIQAVMEDYRPFIYVLSAIGTDKTNQIMRNLDVDYYSVKPIKAKAVASNLQKLLDVETALTYPAKMQLELDKPLPSLDVDGKIQDYLYELGAPLYRLSTNCTFIALQLCLEDDSVLKNITSMYRIVATKCTHPATYASVERNIRSSIATIQKINNSFYQQCFPDKNIKLSNTYFLNSSVYILRRRIGEYLSDQISVRKNSEVYSTK